jgi:hypothetical protein
MTVEPLTTALVTVAESIPTKMLYADAGAVALPNVSLKESVTVFPLAWLGFSVIRGIATNWWPYWFINPNGEAGLGGMLTYIAAITGFFLVLGLAVLGLKQVLRRLVLR